MFSQDAFKIVNDHTLLVMDIFLLLPSLTRFLHVKALESASQNALLKAPTLGALSSPLRQFMSILCCRIKANFQGLYMNPGLSRRRFRRFKGSSMPVGRKCSVMQTFSWHTGGPRPHPGRNQDDTQQ